MDTVPAADLRTNIGTWAVPDRAIPDLACRMTATLKREAFDPDFRGQELTTVYFDTRNLDLQRARLRKSQYAVVRIRCYKPGGTYALSLKTQSEKFRVEIASAVAETFLTAGMDPALWQEYFPAHLYARLVDLTGLLAIFPTAVIHFTRYAVEDEVDRLTLDIGIRSHVGKVFPCAGVLEFKSTNPASVPELVDGLQPIRLSKFLWAVNFK
jgi:hypothetical protein